MDKKALILVVDDNASTVNCSRGLWIGTVSRRFRPNPAARHVESAIKCRPAVVLMDLNMPGMNGYEATRAIHADRHTRGIPVVAVSADCADFERWASKADFVTVLEKPWKPEALLEILTNVLISHDKARVQLKHS